MRMILAALAVVALLACGSSLPKNVLPQEKFREVMWDLTRSAEFINAFKNYSDSSEQKVADQLMYQDKVLAIHKVTREQFITSYAYYRDRPDIMKEMLDSLSKKPQAKNIDTLAGKKDTGAAVSSNSPADTLAVRDSAIRKPVKIDSNRRRGGQSLRGAATK